MADWQTARYDATYEEPLDAEIIPLCDALNDAGIVTSSSCCGHGTRWPYVCFDHSTDERIERLARFVLASEAGDYRAHYTMWQKEILPDGYRWSVHVHLNNAYANTPPADFLAMAVEAIDATARAVQRWQRACTELYLPPFSYP